jgi:hypothetical protein
VQGRGGSGIQVRLGSNTHGSKRSAGRPRRIPGRG